MLCYNINTRWITNLKKNNSKALALQSRIKLKCKANRPTENHLLSYTSGFITIIK